MDRQSVRGCLRHGTRVRRGVERALIPAAIALALACSGEPGVAAPSDDAPPAPASPSAADASAVERIQRTANGCDPEGDNCTFARFEWPKVSLGSEAATAAVRNYLRRAMSEDGEGAYAESPEALAERFVADYLEFGEEFPESQMSWSLERTAQVIYRSPRVLSLAVSEFSYTGGAHPNSHAQLASFHADTGERITLAELVAASHHDDLRAVGEAEFRRQKEIPAGQGLEDAGYWFESGFALNENFAITAEGLVFHYNSYEIAPYAAGPTDLELSAQALSGLLRADAPLPGASVPADAAP